MVSLRETTYNLLKDRNPEVTLPQISQEAKLSLDWLRSFALKGLTLKNGSAVDNVQKLYEYLSGKSLL